MAEPSLQLGNGNWAGKSDNLLAYHKANNNFYADELTFARASTGTIVNSDGLIEEVPYNLIEQSNDFDTTWSVGNSTITGGQADKDGGTSAWVIASTTIGSETRIRQSQTFTVGEVIALSCYMKAGTVNFGIVRTYSIAGGGRVWFNLLNGTVGTENSGLTGSIESVGGGWYRCSITGVVTNTGAIDIAPAPADNDYLADAVGESIYIQDAQLNSGSTAKTYYPTTTRLNIPRVDYLNNSNGSLKLEPQRTNLVTQSSDFSNAAWDEDGVTIAANNTTSPDGTTNADKFLETAVNGIHLINNTSPITASATSTASVFYKKGTRRYFSIKILIGSNSYTQVFDSEGLTTGGNSSNGLTNVVTKIEDYGNGWVRASVAGTSASGTSTYIIVGLSNSLNPTFNPTNYNPTYQGSVTDYGYFYGAMLEAGSYATSIIPTSGTTVTRIQDTSSTTGLSDVIGQTEGTLFVEISAFSGANTDRQISISDGGTSNRVVMALLYNGTQIQFVVASGGSITVNTTQTIATITSGTKIAFAYKANDFKIYANGLLIASDTSGAVPIGLDTLGFDRGDGNDVFEGNVKNLQLYKTRLSNTELATLTTI